MARRKASIDDLRNSIDASLAKLAAKQGGLKVPIDLAEVCGIIGVDWELRWMVPEGVTAVVGNKLKIFIRSNFSEEQIADNRLRFTWAHEICHALLYDLSSSPPKPAADTPKGAALEWLCQNGAGYLLMPTREIRRIFNLSRPLSSIDDVLWLSKEFGASIEATIRRLKQESDCLRAGYAIILIRNQNGEDEILSAAHDVWLKTLLPDFTRGTRFTECAKPFMSGAVQIGPDEWEKGSVRMRVAPISRYLSAAEFTQI